MGVLAMEPIQISLAVMNMALTIIVALGLFVLNNRQRKQDGLESRLETQIKEAADERHVRTIDFIETSMAEIRAKLKDAEKEIDGATTRSHKIELLIAAKFDQVKDLIHARTASKEDLAAHQGSMAAKADRIDGRLGGLEKQVAVLGDRIGPRES